MIPIRLELTDFLSYRGFHSLNFASIHVASIVGPNGSGKSALLDAISWVLFGRSREHRITGRKTNKQRDAVINDLADSCEVSLEFEVEGNRFLVNRAIDRGKGGWRVQFKHLTQSGEENIREKGNIDHIIEKEIGITYDVFFSSSFITQGDSSRFMDASVSARLEVLSEILDLSAYEDCLTETKTQLKETDFELKHLSVRIEEAELQTEIIPELEHELKIADETSENLSNSWNKLRDEIDSVKNIILKLEYKMKVITENREELKSVSSEISKLVKNIENIEAEITSLKSIIQSSEEIENGYSRYRVVQKNLDEINEKKVRHEEISRNISKLETIIKVEKGKIAARIESFTLQIKNLQSFLAENIEAAEKLEKIIFDRKSLENVKKELEALRDTSREKEVVTGRLTDNLETLESQNKSLLVHTGFSEISEVEAEIDFLGDEYKNVYSNKTSELETTLQKTQNIRDNISTTKSTIYHLKEELKLLASGEGGQCPLCGSELSADSGADLVSGRENEINKLSVNFSKYQDNLFDAENNLKILKAELKKLELRFSKMSDLKKIIENNSNCKEFKNKLETEKNIFEKILGEINSLTEKNNTLLGSEKKLEAEFVNLSSTIKSLDEKKLTLEDTDKSLDKLKKKLSENIFCETEQKELKIFKINLEDNGFDTVLYQNISADEKEFRPCLQKYQELEIAREKVSSKSEELSRTKERTTKLQIKENELSENTKSEKIVTEELAENQKNISSLKINFDALQIKRDEAISTLQRQSTLLESARDAQKILTEFRDKSNSLSVDSEILRRLKTMFGRDGIPNQILEGVVPQLEEVANEILEQISKGRHGGEAMRMRFELSRESATGKKNAALDIILSDGRNERPYELFSGGERFRADFAIRLALSHILARRSGRRLRLLVIDEGFGTQDAEGVSALVSAIHDVSEDFEKVLVVSHVDEIKNHFDRQIQVWRDSDGSHFELV